MRKNWSKNEDSVLKKIVSEVGLNDWTAVASRLKLKYEQIERTGKQCRERWYNHLDPNVNKEVWSYEEELLLFESHRELGNRWKEISLRLKGRTDNNIKNHFYSTLRRSLRRLNKIIGQKNSTLHMREIKPSVLTIILNFIYDHQQENNQNGGEFIQQIKDLPRLIFEFAQFKPVKSNMDAALKQSHRRKIETIFNLVEQFKESYFNEKNDKKKYSDEGYVLSQDSPAIKASETHINRKSEAKTGNLVDSHSKPEEGNAYHESSKCDSNEKDKQMDMEKLLFENEGNSNNIMEIEEPSPITFTELIIVGKHWSPKREEQEPQEQYIDQILEMNYE